PLLAIDLHVDEELVHEPRDLRVLEALVRHHVAPVAGRVSDRHEHRLVELLRARERLGAPRIPVDGVVLVLEQVRRGLAREAVGHERGLARPRYGWTPSAPVMFSNPLAP